MLVKDGRSRSLCLFWNKWTNRLAGTSFPGQPDAYIHVFQYSTKVMAVPVGKLIHSMHISSNVLGLNMATANTLISMYVECGNIESSHQLFDTMQIRNVFTWTMVIAGYLQSNHPWEALKLLIEMQESGIRPDKVVLIYALGACAKLSFLQLGKQVHAQILGCQWESSINVSNSLVDMYVKCGSVNDAHTVFVSMIKRDNISWNAMVAGYSHQGHWQEEFRLFMEMQQEEMKANRATFLSIISHAPDLQRGKHVHSTVIKAGSYEDEVFDSAFVHMYVNCGSMEKAKEIFDRMPKRNVFTWTALFAGCAGTWGGKDAFKLFLRMQMEGIVPDMVAFVNLICACCDNGDWQQGKQVHAAFINHVQLNDTSINNKLIDMYCQCGNINYAQEVFDRTITRNTVSWNIISSGYNRLGDANGAVKLFKAMRQEGVDPDKVTFISVLGAVASIPATFSLGKGVHAEVIASKLEDVLLETSIIDMYSRCGSLKDARHIFDRMFDYTVVSYNVIITGYAINGNVLEALHIYQSMQEGNLEANEDTLIAILNICCTNSNIGHGKVIHAHILKTEHNSNVILSNILLQMYVSCGVSKDAWQLFDSMLNRDTVSWNTIIAGHVLNSKHAFKLFNQMQEEEEEIEPDNTTFVNALSAYAASSDIASHGQGKYLHSSILKDKREIDCYVSSAIIGMYANRSMENACRVFDSMPVRDVIMWNVIISRYAEHGHAKKSLQLFAEMQHEGVKPNKATFICVLSSCATIAILEQGKWLHESIIKAGYEVDIVIGSSLINMYAKCGSVLDSRKVFNSMPQQDSVSWNAIIAGYAQHGNSSQALTMFSQMQRMGVKPNSTSFVLVLYVCSHMCILDDGCHYFMLMIHDYDIAPILQHYVCMIDLFSRAGCLDHAEEFLKTMPFLPGALAWALLLKSCS